MKLELKHLAPYLPYKLECVYTDTFGQIEKGYLTTLMTPDILSVNCCIDKDAKPILRPLINYNLHSFNNCFSYDEKAECFISDNGETIIEFSNIDLPYWFTQLLFEHHFDVFGLIEKGLAIDKNTLSK